LKDTFEPPIISGKDFILVAIVPELYSSSFARRKTEMDEPLLISLLFLVEVSIL
jgi:hypothetical protein